MGKLIKVHWARLIFLVAATYQVAAGLEGIFWPKIFFDWLTKVLDPAVKPIPILPIINIVFGVLAFALEWPLPLITRFVPSVHSCIELRLILYPLFSLAGLILYQGTNAGLYYIIGIGVLFWGFFEGESICAEPWTLPRLSAVTTRGKPMAVEMPV